MSVHVLMNTGGIAATNCYLVGDEALRQAVLFDAPNDTTAMLLDEAQKRGWDLMGLWLTHGHFDHVADHAVVTERFPRARVLIHRLDEPKLLGQASSPFAIPLRIPPRAADGYVDEGQELELGSARVRVLHTPGHSPGHVMYHLPDEKILIGGDLIIMNAIGRTDLPDSDHAQLEQSVRRIMRLPHDTRLLPGHGEPTTLQQELQTNPYVAQIMRGPRGIDAQ